MGTEGKPITLNASFPTDPDGNFLNYRWDFENDGTYDTKWLNGPLTTYTPTDNSEGTLKVLVFDGASYDTATAQITIMNSDPIVNLEADKKANPEEEISFDGKFSDLGLKDTHKIEWNFGDETTASNVLEATHKYSEPGKYIVVLKVTDDDGGVGTHDDCKNRNRYFNKTRHLLSVTWRNHNIQCLDLQPA